LEIGPTRLLPIVCHEPIIWFIRLKYNKIMSRLGKLIGSKLGNWLTSNIDIPRKTPNPPPNLFTLQGMPFFPTFLWSITLFPNE
jgi:hypothetical protein